MAKASMNHKSSQKPTFRPLSIEQKNAVDLLITGATDAEVAAAVGVSRETIWSYRNEHPVFMAELQRARADLFRQPIERLRSLALKAVANIEQAINDGDVRASFELLKATGTYSQLLPTHEDDPDTLFDHMVGERLAKEKIRPELDTELINPLRNRHYDQRREEIEAELWATYGEDQD
jgi:DNA-binding XRE family transcriptional regulator